MRLALDKQVVALYCLRYTSERYGKALDAIDHMQRLVTRHPHGRVDNGNTVREEVAASATLLSRCDEKLASQLDRALNAAE